MLASSVLNKGTTVGNGRGATWSLALVILLGLLAGCSHDYADPETLAATLEPKTIFAALSMTSTIPKGAAQFAAVLNIDPAVVRIRLKPGDCIVCSLEARPQLSSATGVSVDEAEQIVRKNDEVTFFIPKFSCTFLYDGTTLNPRSCQHAPL
ncbi:MAG: hypothetical protein KDE31_01055 [Caldilineaceae bacterium]|nr:hypothetical protein [Caldilineaceae bacterium]